VLGVCKTACIVSYKRSFQKNLHVVFVCFYASKNDAPVCRLEGCWGFVQKEDPSL